MPAAIPLGPGLFLLGRLGVDALVPRVRLARSIQRAAVDLGLAVDDAVEFLQRGQMLRLGALDEIVQLERIALEVVQRGDLRFVAEPDLVAFVAEHSVGEVAGAAHAVFVEPSRAVAKRHDPVARRVVRLPKQQGSERLAVERHALGQLRLAKLGEGWQQVGKISERIGLASARDEAGGIHDERLADATLVLGGLAAAWPLAVDRAAQAAAGAVVGGENNDRPFADFQLIQRADQAPDKGVCVTHHALQLVPAGGGVALVRRRHERAVREGHREVEHHRLVAMPLHEINEKVAVNVRPKLALVRFAAGAGVDVGVPVTLVARRVAGFVAGPDCPVVEAVFFQRIGLDAEVVDLPLAGDGRGVAGGFHHLRKRGVLGPIKVADTPARHVPVVHPAGAPRVLAGEQRGAGRGALRHRPRVVKLEAALGQAIDVRRLNVVRAIAGDPVLAEVVHHDEQNVGLGRGDGLKAKRTKNCQEKKQAH